MTYRVQMWCRDCTGQDYLGCGDGDPWWLEDRAGIREFESRVEAEDAGIEAAMKAGPYEYEVVET